MEPSASPGQPADVVAKALRTVGLAEQRWATRRHEATVRHLPTLWLRAARAAWAAGAWPEAQTWYRRSADELLLMAERVGHSSGTFPYYAELALGAAAVCGSERLLEHVAGVVRHHAPSRQVRSWWRGTRTHGAEPGLAAHLTVQAWAAWLAGAEYQVVSLAAEAEGEVRGLSPDSAARWRARRWSDLLAALQALLARDVEALGACVRSLDAKLAAGWGDPPLLSEMVDETLVSMVTQRQSMGADQSDIGSLRHVVTLPPSGATT